MTGQLDDTITKQLAALTAWSGETPGVWRRALKSAADRGDFPLARQPRWLTHRAWRNIAACAAVLVVGVTLGSFLLPALHMASQSVAVNSPSQETPVRGGRVLPAPASRRMTETLPMAYDAHDYSHHFVGGELDVVGPPSPASGTLYSCYPSDSTPVQVELGKAYLYDAAPSGSPASAADAARTVADALPRQVIRKATIELAATDVRAVFLKAGLIISQASGEYIEDSALTGTGKETQANLTLRVEASRLDQVLNALRDLGEVRAERVEGQDVTTQVVDIQARLRNEQHVEAELLQLLEKRQDAPLKEVLELREKIGQIRQEIECLTAQRDQFSRVVSLATVLVIIRPGDAPALPASGLYAYFAETCRTAWTASIRFLVDSVAVLLALLVGGFVWWVLLLATILLIRRHLHRKAA